MSVNQTSFRKGQSGNPRGRPKLTLEEKAARCSLKMVLFEAIENSLLDTVSSNEEALKKNDLTGIEFVLRKAVQKGDWRIIENCLDRTLGKPQYEDPFRNPSEMTQEELQEEIEVINIALSNNDIK